MIILNAQQVWPMVQESRRSVRDLFSLAPNGLMRHGTIHITYTTYNQLLHMNGEYARKYEPALTRAQRKRIEQQYIPAQK